MKDFAEGVRILKRGVVIRGIPYILYVHKGTGKSSHKVYF